MALPLGSKMVSDENGNNVMGWVRIWCMVPGQGFKQFRLRCALEHTAEELMTTVLASMPYLQRLFGSASAFDLCEVRRGSQVETLTHHDRPLERVLLWDREFITTAFAVHTSPMGFVMRLNCDQQHQARQPRVKARPERSRLRRARSLFRSASHAKTRGGAQVRPTRSI